MKRWVAWAIGLFVLLLLVFFPAMLGAGKGTLTPDPARITDYRANFRVDEDGDLHAVEKLRVDLPFKHGIFRFFDTRDPYDAGARLVPEDIRVSRDGHAEPFTVLREENGRIRNVKIGSPDVTLDGEHTYVIAYTIPSVLRPHDDQSVFYWNLVPQGWRMPITRAHLTVDLPRAPQGLQCAVGTGATSGCTTEVSGNTLTVTAGELMPNTPVTVRTLLDMTAPARAHLPWSIRFDPVFGTHVILLVVVLLAAVGAGFLGWRVGRGTREEEPAYPLMYGPPDGVGPAQAKYLYSESVGRDAFVASIMHSAEKGATTLTRGEGWTITDTGDAAAWEALDPASTKALTALGVRGGSFTAQKSVSAGKTLKSAIADFERATKQWARSNGLIVSSGLGSLGGVLWCGALAVTVAFALWNPFHLSALALVPGLFTVFAVEVMATGSGTRRTPAGRELWSRIGGFRRILSTSSAEARFEFSGRRELYTAFIPYAVAFGVADQWATKYRTEMGEEPPAPHYFAGYAGYTTGSFTSAMAHDFESAVGSAISAYNASQSSSSGGGGFSGGGGGGGGGGGSW